MSNGTGYSSEELLDDPRTIQTSCSSEDENPISSPKPLDMGVLFAAKWKGLKWALTGSKSSSSARKQRVAEVVNCKPRQAHSAEPTIRRKQSQTTSFTPKSQCGAQTANARRLTCELGEEQKQLQRQQSEKEPSEKQQSLEQLKRQRSL